MDVGVLVRKEVADSIDHRTRPLAGCCVVEVDERLSAHLSSQNRKIGTHPFNVQFGLHLRC
jgi:hypothetical protein